MRCGPGSGLALGGAKSSEHACSFATDDANAGGVCELAGGLLETEVERLLFEVAEAGLKFTGGKHGGLGLGLGSHEI